LDYLRQEENNIPRVGAVAMAGMAGLIFGLRGGFFKKLIYTSTAATGWFWPRNIARFFFIIIQFLGMAALCYPHQAVLITKDVLDNSKKYASIGYNFINGGSNHQ
jgi:MICOS complex subunit MIC27